MLELLAQEAALSDPISGGAGWVGAGLLGLVLSWLLLKHLPSKDKQMEDVIKLQNDRLDAKDEQVVKICDTHAATMKEVANNFTSELREERKSREKMAEAFRCRNYMPTAASENHK